MQATSGTGERVKTVTQTITVTVTDVAGEAPGKPAAPTVTPASVSRLTVTWAAPANAGPAITDYDYRSTGRPHQQGTLDSGDRQPRWHRRSRRRSRSLSEDTSYQVQVRATNDEGTGDVVGLGQRLDGRQRGADVLARRATFDAAENQTAAGTVRATDSDSEDDITGYAITGGADRSFFSIGATSGALTFDAAPNYEDAQDQGTNNTYVVDRAGDQRHGGAGKDGHPDDHGDGHRRARRGTGQAGRAGR